MSSVKRTQTQPLSLAYMTVIIVKNINSPKQLRDNPVPFADYPIVKYTCLQCCGFFFVCVCVCVQKCDVIMTLGSENLLPLSLFFSFLYLKVT